MPLRRVPPGAAWVATALLMALGAVALRGTVDPRAIDWQPLRWLAEPWRWWTAAFVHLSTQHFVLNLAATGLVAAFGVTARVPPRTALAWAAAWPLTHLGLWSMPALQHYGGLSGVLHAGVGAVAVHLCATGPRSQRLIGLATAALLLAKVLSETPWRAAVQTSPHWDIPVAPIAHLTGALAGALCGAAAEALAARPRHRAPPALTAAHD